VQPDGKLILAGRFTSVLGVPRNNIARLNADGSLDTNFDPNANGDVASVTVQPDGKLLIGGDFTSVVSTPRSRVARLFADGTLDPGFNPNPSDGGVRSLVLQSDGKILLGGSFTDLQPNGAASPTTRNRIARLNEDGTLDTGFDPNASAPVFGIAVQADGKVLLGGASTTLQPNGALSSTARNFAARVNADGMLGTSFDPKPDNTVFGLGLQADGKVLLCGEFTSLQPNGSGSTTARNLFARVINDPATSTLSTGPHTEYLTVIRRMMRTSTTKPKSTSKAPVRRRITSPLSTASMCQDNMPGWTFSLGELSTPGVPRSPRTGAVPLR